MTWAGFVVGFISGLGIGLMANFIYDIVKGYACRSLLRSIKVRPTDIGRSVNGDLVYVVEMLVGTGNALVRLIGHRVSICISPVAWFYGENGSRFRALALRVGSQVIDVNDMRSRFDVVSNDCVTLALAKYSGRVMRLYKFGGWASEEPLDGTYDVVLAVQDARGHPVSEHRIPRWIRNGHVVVDEENDSVV